MFKSGFLKEHSQILVWTLKLSDIIVLALTCWLAMGVSLDVWSFRQNYWIGLLVAALLLILVFPVFSVYRTWRGVDLIEETRVVFLGWTLVFVSLAILSVITKTSQEFSRLWFGNWFLFGLIGLLCSRWVIRSLLGYIRKNGLNQRRIVIVGASDLGQHVATEIKSSPWYGYRLDGFFSNLENPSLSPNLIDVPILGSIKDLPAFLSTNSVDQVWIALSMSRSDLIKEVLDGLDTESVDVRYVPDIFSFNLLNHSVTEVAGIPVVNVSVTPMDGVNRIVKAVEDRVLASLILLLISPVLVIVAVCVKLTSPGPVFYRQERVSWNGETFQMIKFRSMPADTEEGEVKWGGGKAKTLHPFGQFIRKTSLDELPQFINVLLGDMSIVGPRPERTVFVDKFKNEIPGYMKKHKVKAGITGWAQINGWRGDTNLHKRIECDLYYIENWSLWFDLKIIALTVIKGFVHKNAY